jgi:hypothetical protein
MEVKAIVPDDEYGDRDIFLHGRSNAYTVKCELYTVKELYQRGSTVPVHEPLAFN